MGVQSSSCLFFGKPGLAVKVRSSCSLLGDTVLRWLIVWFISGWSAGASGG